MKILHTADWHLGVKSDDLDRMPEQIEALKTLEKISLDENVDMVLIAGDVYENFIPSAAAEKLFYDTVIRLSRNGNCAVVVIAGNHDEPKRFSNARAFAASHNIYLVGNINEIEIAPNKNWNIYPIKTGKGYIKFETKQGERANVACLPYPSYYRYQEMKKEGEVFGDKVKEWLSYGEQGFAHGEINLTVAHLLTYGVNLNKLDFEKYEFISSSFPFIDQKFLQNNSHYTALGHLHQDIAVNKEKHIYYSGSLINNFFIGNYFSTCVFVANINAAGVTDVKKVSLNTKTLIQQEVSSIEEANEFCKVNSNQWVKLILKNVHHVPAEEIRQLRNQHKNLVTLSVISEAALKRNANFVSKKNLTNSEIFTKFIEEKTGEKPTTELLNCFLSLMEEITYEANSFKTERN